MVKSQRKETRRGPCFWRIRSPHHDPTWVYKEMAAEGLIDFEELRTWLSALGENRNTAERELHALRHHTEHLERLERDRDSLLESHVGLVPEAIDGLGSEERHRVYRMIGMKAYLTADGSFELSGDVMNFSSQEISSA